MSDERDAASPEPVEYLGYYEDGVIRLAARTNWANGTAVCVRVANLTPEDAARRFGKVIIAGFGLAGRWVADIFDRHGIEYVVVEENPQTVETQGKLGRHMIQGDIGDEQTLRRADIEGASILVLTAPDEAAVLRATQIARQIRPDIYIVARTTHVSAGIQASQYGANEVIKAEQVVARHFYEMLLRKVLAANGKPDDESLDLK
ncbi:MAG: NAD-binding protein [Planctomycetes bacterium]|nr:NAD-binding protein [Planctomycetota bacterium]